MKNRLSVLVVDESQTFSMYLALLLQHFGFKSLRVSQTESAKFVLSRGFTDAMIIGDLAGGEPKHQVVEELASCIHGALVPIIALSSHDDPVERQACEEAGCKGHLLKPVQPKALHEVLYSNILFSGKRVHLRSKVDMTAEISITGQPTQALRLLTLSRGGALVAYDNHLPQGTNVSMKLPLGEELLDLTGSVIYNLSAIDAQTSRAFCLHFDRMPAQLGAKIEGYLETSLEKFSSFRREIPADPGHAALV
jgi:CheY-like chemotaxis protein